jgi:threonyl-tRNA synthetase
MIEITFPDGNKKIFNKKVSIIDVAREISPSLAKQAIAGEVDNTLSDLSVIIGQNCHLRIITKDDPEGLEIIRHSCAHLIGHAVKQLYPSAKMAIGPVIENGFFYDIEFEENLSEFDLKNIESKVNTLVKQNYDVVREVVDPQKALDVFKKRNEDYKIEIVKGIPSGETIALYHHQEYVDMCRGPHVPNTKFLRHFKLMKIAGAYWRGNAKNKMLQRIYGTAWTTKQDLDDYLFQIEEAEKRDHRKLGKTLELFHYQDSAPGMAFWHPNGTVLWTTVESYLRTVYKKSSFSEVRCPLMLDKSLWEKSGHWEHYREHMFLTASENREYAIKPMNCPGHVQIFNSKLRSYRDLPLRLGEFGSCHRNEPSGALHGLFRLRNFTQDDGHIFCTEEQVQKEVFEFTKQLQKVYEDFGFSKIIYKLSTRPEKRVGDDKTWDKSEKALKNALNDSGVEWETLEGEGAFYGPKIEYSLKDSLSRVWQCGTIQIDFNMPKQLGAEYVTENNQRNTPVMLHRAIVGSLERFIGILIENYAGALPLWLAPVQVGIASISQEQTEYVNKLASILASKGFRVDEDLRNEKISYKIREFSFRKIPFVLAVGKSEQRSESVSVRKRGSKALTMMALNELFEVLERDLDSKK